MQYGSLERYIAEGLNRFPRVKSAAKSAYQRLSYAPYLLRGQQRVVVSEGIQLRQPIAPDVTDGSHPPFFGYYDRCPWNLTGESYVVHVPENQHGILQVWVSTSHGRSAINIGTTSAWNYQQGAMTMWVPGLADTVVFNSVSERLLGSRWVTLSRGTTEVLGDRFVPWPIQALHPDGIQGLALNYRRLSRLRPEYGYAADVANFHPDQPDTQEGIWQVDYREGKGDLLISLAELQARDSVASMQSAQHKVNHIMYSPNGERFVFMHRWISSSGKWSRLYVGRHGEAIDGLRLLMDERVVSHYSWIDDTRLIVWGTHNGRSGYHIVEVSGGRIEPFAEDLDRYGDGHPSFSPDGRWMVTDTYPDKARMRHLLLFDSETLQKHQVASFFAPWKFDGPVRCDLHPRWSPDGKRISIDSAHDGYRNNYILDVSGVVL
jgi:hypothetical protein